jgi:ATP-dependent helicase/nuclease subunit B
VEQLRAFHRLAYGDALHDTGLERLARMRDIEVADRRTPRPAAPAMANVTPSSAYFPDALSATAHQRLINCPYQFYCTEILGLTPEEEVREEIEKADYGSYVHRILQAFHVGVPGLPGPWRGPLTMEHLTSASMLMQEIAGAVFAQDLRRSYLVRGWLYRWLESLPAYLAWQIAREAHWQIAAAEIRKESKTCDGDVCLTLTGRIDRLDRGHDGYAIIDYKTGALPAREDMLNGEQVQLTHYALLCDDTPSQAQFLGLLRDDVTDKVRLEGPELAAITAQVRERLLRLYRDMKHGTKLTAWGDPDTCKVCAMEGICRRELWGD